MIGLSKSEKQILNGLKEGKGLEQVAEEMNIVPGTIYVHIGKLRKKYAESEAFIRKMDAYCRNNNVNYYLKLKGFNVAEVEKELAKGLRLIRA